MTVTVVHDPRWLGTLLGGMLAIFICLECFILCGAGCSRTCFEELKKSQRMHAYSRCVLFPYPLPLVLLKTHGQGGAGEGVEGCSQFFLEEKLCQEVISSLGPSTFVY